MGKHAVDVFDALLPYFLQNSDWFEMRHPKWEAKTTRVKVMLMFSACYWLFQICSLPKSVHFPNLFTPQVCSLSLLLHYGCTIVANHSICRFWDACSIVVLNSYERLREVFRPLIPYQNQCKCKQTRKRNHDRATGNRITAIGSRITTPQEIVIDWLQFRPIIQMAHLHFQLAHRGFLSRALTLRHHRQSGRLNCRV